MDSEKKIIVGDRKLSHTITYYRNENGPCDKEVATQIIIHEFDHDGRLVNCIYRELTPA